MVELAYPQLETVHPGDEEIITRRLALANVYDALPEYGCLAFWHAIAEPDIPLEVLVRCVRVAVAQEDDEGRNRIVEVIVRRTATSNAYWAKNVLQTVSLQTLERSAFVNDLYADLYECLIRALIDPKRTFWAENFHHCLRFERKHVYRSFMVREGHWYNQHAENSARIPRALVTSLDQPVQHQDGELSEPTIEDELAQKALLAVEQTDLLRLIFCLPDKLKSVVLLIFWEGRTEKDTARLLGITDRTVRNRLRDALQILYSKLAPEREYSNG